MTALAPARRPFQLQPMVGAAALAAVALLALSALRHPPRLELIADAATPIRIHLAAACTTFLLGAVLMLGPKGRLPHRTLGWIWAAAMAVTAVSSLFIQEIRPGQFSFIHAFSGWVIVALPAALYAARARKLRLHRKTMTGLYVGGMFLAGGFAFLPGRLMWAVFFG